MKQYLILILIAFHLISSSLYATKTFLDKGHIHTDKCYIHEDHHFHNGATYQHKHNHSQINMNFLDFFTDNKNINTLKSHNIKEKYLETASWIPNPTLESLFRPPKI